MTWQSYRQFTGYQTKIDREKIPDGACPEGQNVSPNEGDKISIRSLGYENLPASAAESTTTNPITSQHTFHKRDGTSILMRSQTTLLEAYDLLTTSWVTIETGYTTGKKFGFADYNINVDLMSYVYFGNAYENYSRWNGSRATFASATVNTITKEGSSTWAASSFLSSNATGASARAVVINGTKYTYTGGESTTTLTGVSPDPTAAGHAVGSVIYQAVETFAGGPKGNIYLNANNRIFVAGVILNPQIVYFTKYGDPINFTAIDTLISTTTLVSAGAFNLGEGGGGVTDACLEEGSIYFFKKSIVYKATLTDGGYSLVPLKPFDGKSQTMGALSGTVFTGGNGVFLITPDKQILLLQRVELIDYPQAVAISDVIKPNLDSSDPSTAIGIVFRDRAFIALKSSTAAPSNDMVLIWNIKNQFWDPPLLGWNVSSWAIYDDGNGDELYFGNSLTTNTFKVITTPSDGQFNVAASWKTKLYDFGKSEERKTLENIFIEGYISMNTTVNIHMYLDEDGFTQSYSGSIAGTDTGYIFTTPIVNMFGDLVFASQPFGSNPDLSGKAKFRVYFKTNLRRVPFYNVQLQFSSEGSNQQWDIVGYGFDVNIDPLPENRNLYKQFA